MKICVACDKEEIANHFGHCESFKIFDCRSNEIEKQTTILNPGHKPGFLPNYLNEQKIDVIISGGMGGGAVDLFNKHKIKVVVGAKGNAKDAALKYLTGELKTSGDICSAHEHENECNS